MYKIHNTGIILSEYFVGQNYYFASADILKNKRIKLIEISTADNCISYPNLNGGGVLPVVDYFIDNSSLFLTLINYDNEQILSQYPVNLLVNDIINPRSNRLKKLFPQMDLYNISLEKSYLTTGQNDPVVNKIMPFSFYYTD
jgi:hypothetical protein